MKLIKILLLLILGAFCYFWIGKRFPEWGEKIQEIFETVSIKTFETSLELKDIIKKQRARGVLLEEEQESICTVYVPHAYMHITYPDTKYTSTEGVLIWDLTDGEMVLTTLSWEKTSGLSRWIKAELSKDQIVLLRDIALHAKPSYPILEENSAELDTLMNKKLLISTEHGVRLHLKHVRLPKIPTTLSEKPLGIVTIAPHGERRKKQFSIEEVERFAQLFFGDSLLIRSSEEVYLPLFLTTASIQDKLLDVALNPINGRLSHSHPAL